MKAFTSNVKATTLKGKKKSTKLNEKPIFQGETSYFNPSFECPANWTELLVKVKTATSSTDQKYSATKGYPDSPEWLCWSPEELGAVFI